MFTPWSPITSVAPCSAHRLARRLHLFSGCEPCEGPSRWSHGWHETLGPLGAATYPESQGKSHGILLVFHSHGGRCWAWNSLILKWNHQLQECGVFLLWEIAGGSIRGDTILGASSWGSGSRRRCFGRRLLATAERLSAQRHTSEDDDHVGIFQDKWQTAHRFGQQ